MIRQEDFDTLADGLVAKGCGSTRSHSSAPYEVGRPLRSYLASLHPLSVGPPSRKLQCKVDPSLANSTSLRPNSNGVEYPRGLNRKTSWVRLRNRRFRWHLRSMR